MRKVLTATILVGLLTEWQDHSGRTLAVDQTADLVQEVQFKQRTDRVDVFVGGAPFTTYYFEGYNKPIFYPLRAPSGTIVTRSYPMIRDVPGEAQDHPHHKGLWLTHGDVNGIDFWSEAPRGGKIVHHRFERIAVDDKIGILRSQNDWLSSEGENVLAEVREVRIQGLQRARIMKLDSRQE